MLIVNSFATIVKKTERDGGDVVVIPLAFAQALLSLIDAVQQHTAEVKRASGDLVTLAGWLEMTVTAPLSECETKWSKDAPIDIKAWIAGLDEYMIEWSELPASIKARIVAYTLAQLSKQHEEVAEAMKYAPHWLPSWTTLYRTYNARWRELKEVSNAAK